MESSSCKTERARPVGDSDIQRAHTCLNAVMNSDHRQLDVLYISDLIKPLERVEVAISVAAI